MVRVEIEYCGYCNFEKQCKDIKQFIKGRLPETEITCTKGRQGAFEIKIEDQLIYSKIQRVAFPDFESVTTNVQRAAEGKPFCVVKEQQIKDCRIQ